MLGALTLLLVFQLAGEAIALYFALPIPGPVIGIIAMGVAERLGGLPSLGHPHRHSWRRRCRRPVHPDEN